MAVRMIDQDGHMGMGWQVADLHTLAGFQVYASVEIAGGAKRCRRATGYKAECDRRPSKATAFHATFEYLSFHEHPARHDACVRRFSPGAVEAMHDQNRTYAN